MAIATLNASSMGFSGRRTQSIMKQGAANDNPNVVKASSSLLKPQFLLQISESLLNLNIQLRRLDQSSAAIVQAAERLVSTIKKMNDEMVSKFRALGTEIYMANKDLLGFVSRIAPVPSEDEDASGRPTREGSPKQKGPKQSWFDRLLKLLFAFRLLRNAFRFVGKILKLTRLLAVGAFKIAWNLSKFLLNPGKYLERWTRAIANTASNLIKKVGNFFKSVGNWGARLGASIAEKLKPMTEFLSKTWKSFVSGYNKLDIKGTVTKAIEAFKNSKFFTNFKSTIMSSIDILAKRVSTLWQVSMQSAANWFRASAAAIGRSAGSMWSSAKAMLSQGGSNFKNALSMFTAFTGAGKGVAGAAAKVATVATVGTTVTKVFKGAARIGGAVVTAPLLAFDILSFLGEKRAAKDLADLRQDDQLFGEFTTKVNDLKKTRDQEDAEIKQEREFLVDQRGKMDDREWNRRQKENYKKKGVWTYGAGKYKADVAKLLLDYAKKAREKKTATSGVGADLGGITPNMNVGENTPTSKSKSSAPAPAAAPTPNAGKTQHDKKDPEQSKEKAGAPTPAAPAAAKPGAPTPAATPSAKPAGAPTPAAKEGSKPAGAPSKAATPPSAAPSSNDKVEAESSADELKQKIINLEGKKAEGIKENEEKEAAPEPKVTPYSFATPKVTTGMNLIRGSEATDPNNPATGSSSVIVNNNEKETNASGTTGNADGGAGMRNLPLIVVDPLFSSYAKRLTGDH